MCMTTDGSLTQGSLTMACLLNDPLTQAVMRSDGVSEHELTALLVRVRNRLADRAPRSAPRPAPRPAQVRELAAV